MGSGVDSASMTPRRPGINDCSMRGLTAYQERALRSQYVKLNPVELTRDIVRYQGTLISKAIGKTEVQMAEVTHAQKNRRKRQTGGVKVRTD